MSDYCGSVGFTCQRVTQIVFTGFVPGPKPAGKSFAKPDADAHREASELKLASGSGSRCTRVGSALRSVERIPRDRTGRWRTLMR